VRILLDESAMHGQGFLWLALRNKKRGQWVPNKKWIGRATRHQAQKQLRFMSGFALRKSQPTATIDESPPRQIIKRVRFQHPLRSSHRFLDLASGDQHLVPAAKCNEVT
jgi:hypothetical protein